MLKNLRNKLNQKKNKKGFTLIELIIVIAIIAILAALLLPKLGSVKENSNKTADIAEAKKIGDAAQTLYAEDQVTGDDTNWITIDGTGNANTDDAKLENYLGYTTASFPTTKSKSVTVGAGSNFYVQIKKDGTVNVRVGSSGGTLVYPNSTSEYKHK